MNEMMAKLADAPHEKRVEAINANLRMLIEQSDTERTESMKRLIMDLSELPDTKKMQIIADRTTCIAELPQGQMQTILAARARVSLKLPSNVNTSDLKGTFMSLKQLPETKRSVFINEVRNAFKNANIPVPEIDTLIGS